MEPIEKKSLVTAEDRVALGWLWRNFMRKRVWAIVIIFALVLVNGLSMVGFIALLNSTFTPFFSPTNGEFIFNDKLATLHEGGGFADANGDGVYEVSVQVLIDDELAGEPVPLRISVDDTGDSANEIGIFDGQVYSDGVIAFSPDLILSQVAGENVTLGELSGADALAVNFDSAQSSEVLIRLLVLLALMITLRIIAGYLSGRFAAWTAANAILELRTHLLNRLISLDLSYFDNSNLGRLMLRVNGLPAKMRTFFSSELIQIAQAAITVLGSLFYLLWLNAGLFIIIIFTYPVAIFGVRWLTMRLRKFAEQGIEISAAYITNLENTVGGIRTIKLTNQSTRATGQLVHGATEIAKLAIRRSKYSVLIVPLVDLLAAICVILVIGLGGMAVINGWMGLNAATLITFVLALALLFDPATRLSRFNAKFATILVALAEIFELENERPKIVDAPDAVKEFDAAGDINFHNVSFAYDPEVTLFDGLDLRLEGGKTTALVGQTGSGKTTIMSLIARLYEPTAGEIRLGDLDLRRIQAGALRDAFSVVAQDIFIFNNTIEQNIRFVAPNATDAQVAAAAEKAQLAALIAEKGESFVGPRGAQLSGGQRQRIAIARAFLTDAPIVLLDEATSALDQNTEAKVTQALRTLAKDKTTLIIAHRLSTVTHADKIIVLDQGKVAEEGSHRALMAKQGLYAALYEAQQSDSEKGDAEA